MRALIRLGRSCPTPLFSLLLAAGLFFALPRSGRAPAPAAAAESREPILVNSPLPESSTKPGVLTLTDALARAAADPGDDVIQFDPQLLGNEPVIIRLTESITRPAGAKGHDRLDGSALQGGLTLDLSACAEGVLLAGDTRMTLAALTLRGGRQRVVLAKDRAQLTLEQVCVTEGAGPGIALFGEATLNFKGGKLIANRTHGIELHARSSAALAGVEFSRNSQSGIAGFDEAAVAGTDCRFEPSGEWGMVLTQDSRAHLTRCSLQSGRFANVDLSGSSSCRLQECSIERGQRFGVFATGRSRVEVLGTTLRGHGGRGIELQDSATLTMEGSRIESNGDYGLILFGESKVSASGSAIGNNAAHGVSIRGLASGTFIDCSFTGNRFSGLGCLDAQGAGKVKATRCLFRHNGMRPLYRGPMHIDPLVPTPISIDGTRVDCMADPGATIELYVDAAGEASRYLKTVKADNLGRFGVDCRDVPEGWVMTASATANGSTSEFNVVAGTSARPVLDALLARTGPLSDEGGDVNLDTLLRRWKTGTQLVFLVDQPPSVAVERYLQFLVARVPEWTGGTVSAAVRLGTAGKIADSAVVVPVRYVSSDSPQLLGRGGVTLMKWDASGYFLSPMEIMLAGTKDPQESCPRVLAHEIGHALGLCHTRVGLLSRMQGSTAPSKAFVNDFSPMMTYYDVLALHLLHDRRSMPGLTLRKLLERGVVPGTPAPQVAEARTASAEPSFSPAPDPRARPVVPRSSRRP